MTRLTPQRGLPGAWLLRLGRLIFDEAVLSTVVRPTIADLQRELRDAGSNRRARRLAIWRGYRAFWTLALVAPFAFWGAPVPGRAPIAFPDLAARIAVTCIVLTVITLNQSALGLWAAVVGVGGTCFAVAIHRWHSRHPLSVAVPAALMAPRGPHLLRPHLLPGINMSAIPVGGDVGGMLFVLGSMLAVLTGLPVVRLFLLAAVVLGALLAWALLAWHASHPLRLHPENQILLR
jgi:hypothetical protein